MGCDVHAFLEYSTFTDQQGEPYWDCFAANIGHRDYDFFSVLANCGRGSHQPFKPNKGLPAGKLSWKAEHYMYVTVDDEAAEKYPDDNYVTVATAEGWGNPIIETSGPNGRVFRKIANPDLHSHTWYDHDEFSQLIGHWIANVPHDYPYGVEWDAALAAMRALHERGFQTRLVIAFDN